MVGLIWVLATGAVAFFVASVWLVGLQARRRRVAYQHVADERGWDYREDAAQDLVAYAATFGRVDALGKHHLAGPSTAGPFRMCTLHDQGPEKKADATLVHLRTVTSSPGLVLTPSSRFRLFRTDAPESARPDHEGFRRRYQIEASDPTFADDALDWEACALLLRPHNGVSLRWRGNDLLMLFPLAAKSARGTETLLAYAAAVARRIDPHGRRPAARRADWTRHPTPSSTPA